MGEVSRTPSPVLQVQEESTQNAVKNCPQGSDSAINSEGGVKGDNAGSRIWQLIEQEFMVGTRRV